MSPLVRKARAQLGELTVTALLGLTVLFMVFGSSSVPELVRLGSKLRWAALIALAVAALVMVAHDLLLKRPTTGHTWVRASSLGVWFTCLALLSTAWSVDPHLTFGRAASFAVLLTAAVALSLAATTRHRLASRMLGAVLVGTVIVAVAGLALLGIDHAAAVETATVQNPSRLRGLGENPDTVAMLEGIATPIALWATLRARTSARRVTGIGALVLLIGSIGASGSRGGLVAALIGGVVFSLLYPVSARQRAALVLAMFLAVAGATGITKIPKPLPSITVAPGTTAPTPKPGGPTVVPLPGTFVGSPERQYSGRLEDELGRLENGKRSIFQSSGRLQAWSGAIHQADARPLLGYGFGTENHVFIDRFYNFAGAYVENSFVGMYLQLGVVGIASFLALLATLGAGAIRAVRRLGDAGNEAPALAAVFGAGVALMLVQSYAYSVGNVATVAFWCLSFCAARAAPALLPPLGRPAARGKEETVVVA